MIAYTAYNKNMIQKINNRHLSILYTWVDMYCNAWLYYLSDLANLDDDDEKDKPPTYQRSQKENTNSCSSLVTSSTQQTITAYLKANSEVK